MEQEFVTAAKALQGESGPIVELPSVLNRMSGPRPGQTDAEYIDEIDRLINDLYLRRQLSIPTQRWLPGDSPTTLRGSHTMLFQVGYLFRDPTGGWWAWRDHCSYLHVW